jgi:hypothetical protein
MPFMIGTSGYVGVIYQLQEKKNSIFHPFLERK